MKKKTILEEIFNKDYDGMYAQIRFSDLPKDLKDTDIIDIRRDEGLHSENESYGDSTELVIIREREETDLEYEKRISENKIFQEMLKHKRYKHYLELKEEFENIN